MYNNYTRLFGQLVSVLLILLHVELKSNHRFISILPNILENVSSLASRKL